ncbi:MAG: Na/Pi symporter, partial [Acidobacteriota bacterium]
VIFKNAGRAMLLGIMLTVLVQSSSITTSLVVPLAGAGILTLTQIFPYTLGANIGTTITAMLAALALGVDVAVAVAFAHLLFNIFGICVVWPIGVIRRVPMILAQGLAEIAASHRWLAIVYVLTAFYVIPFIVILVLG